MKIKLLLILLFVCFEAESQFFRIENFGLREELCINMLNSQDEVLPAFTTSVIYKKNNWVMVSGIVLTERDVKVHKSSWSYELENRLGLLGFTIGGKYYIKYYPKTRVYHFIDNMLLTYKSYEIFYENSNHNKSELLLSSGTDKNKTLVLQPILGSGVEIEFLNYLTFSLDFGVGITYRHIKYSDRFEDSPTHRTSYTGQLKIGIGCKFE